MDIAITVVTGLLIVSTVVLERRLRRLEGAIRLHLRAHDARHASLHRHGLNGHLPVPVEDLLEKELSDDRR